LAQSEGDAFKEWDTFWTADSTKYDGIALIPLLEEHSPASFERGLVSETFMLPDVKNPHQELGIL